MCQFLPGKKAAKVLITVSELVINGIFTFLSSIGG